MTVMRRTGLLVVLTVCAAFLQASAASATDRGAEQAAQVIPGSYIVTFKDSVSDVGRATAAREGRMGFSARFRYAHAIKGFSARLNDRQLAGLRADPAVASIEMNRLVQATLQTVPTGIKRIGAYANNTANGPGAATAVIDTGVDLDRPELNVVGGTNCVAPGASYDDDNGHGSHVAGTIGAVNNTEGVVGVAPGTPIYAVKVLDRRGSGSWDQIICGINWVTANASDLTIEAANMSLGGLGTSADNQPCTDDKTSALHKAICTSSQGVRYAVAAGNDAWEYPHPTSPDVPAAYREVVTVTAMSDSDGLTGGAGGDPTCRRGEHDDYYASFSNYSDNLTDSLHTIAAPGVCILSTWKDAGYNTISGTSMAAPHVTGAIALRAAANGNYTTNPREIVSDLDSATGGFYGDGNQSLTNPYRYFGFMTIISSTSGGGSTQPTGTFELGVTPDAVVDVRRRKTDRSTAINVTGNFTGRVSLTVSGAANGVSASLNPTFLDPPFSALKTSTLTVKGGDRPTTVTLTITGTGGTVTDTVAVIVHVT